MSYRITYENGGRRSGIGKNNPKSTPKAMRWFALLIVILLFVAILQIDKVRMSLLPGNDAVTEAAIDDFVRIIQNGAPLENAITAFCRRVLENAG